jgi:hypothetical protein
MPIMNIQICVLQCTVPIRIECYLAVSKATYYQPPLHTMSFSPIIPYSHNFETFMIVLSTIGATGGYLQAHTIYKQQSSYGVSRIAWYLALVNHSFGLVYSLMIGNTAILAASIAGLGGAASALCAIYVYHIRDYSSDLQNKL